MREAIAEYWPSELKTTGESTITAQFFDDPLKVETAHWFLYQIEKGANEAIENQWEAARNNYRQNKATGRGLEFALFKTEDDVEKVYPRKYIRDMYVYSKKDETWGKSQKRAASLSDKGEIPSSDETGRKIQEMFEQVAERYLIQPTFIIDFPKAISPLSKASPADPTVAERFELYINGMECANGFSELNAPDEQYERFIEQMQQRERGDEEAMLLDEDYIRALSYGMPPAAGIGIGIDRLVMLLTNRHSIRDVILFPHLRPERKPEEEQEEPQKQP
jgi:lysyl-tRNA synthetase class II